MAGRTCARRTPRRSSAISTAAATPGTGLRGAARLHRLGRLAPPDLPLLGDPDPSVAILTSSQASLPATAPRARVCPRGARDGALDLLAALRELTIACSSHPAVRGGPSPERGTVRGRPGGLAVPIVRRRLPARTQRTRDAHPFGSSSGSTSSRRSPWNGSCSMSTSRICSCVIDKVTQAERSVFRDTGWARRPR